MINYSVSATHKRGPVVHKVFPQTGTKAENLGGARRLVGAVQPGSSIISAITSIGFIGFFVFMLSVGIALLRRRIRRDGVTQVSAQAPS
jgi:hypothetical protein